MTASKYEHPERRIRFDGTISAGNILTAITLIVALVVWGSRLEGRVNMTEQRLEAVERMAAANSQAVTSEMARIEARITTQIGAVQAQLGELRSVLLRGPARPFPEAE